MASPMLHPGEYMCQHCFTRSCFACATKLLSEHGRNQCPHCLQPLSRELQTKWCSVDRISTKLEKLHEEKHKDKCHLHFKKMNMFCLECKAPICSQCISTHDGHSVKLLQDEYNEKVVEFTRTLTEAKYKPTAVANDLLIYIESYRESQRILKAKMRSNPELGLARRMYSSVKRKKNLAKMQMLSLSINRTAMLETLTGIERQIRKFSKSEMVMSIKNINSTIREISDRAVAGTLTAILFEFEEVTSHVRA